MQVSLEEIQFNHGTIQDTGAFNLRRNEALWITLPEWRRSDGCTNPADSPAAYAKSCLPAELTIKASFICDDMAVTSVKVRAWSGEIVEEANSAVCAGHVLGDICQHEIPLKNGQSGQVSLKLTNAKIRNVGIGIHDITWRWQFSADSVNWTDFQTTRHRIYIVLAMPQEPWEPKSSEPSNIHIPWTDVLDYVCSWAVGVKLDLDEAASRVTHNVYRLGESLVTYDAAPSYANNQFECTKFLKLLSTGMGNQTLNCDDCATVVSTFANVLGCDLSQSGMGIFFATNPILLIGNKDWEPRDFGHHCVAWKGAAEKGDALFDSCLQVDGDPSPDMLPHVAFQPVNVQFGDFRDGQYKFSFVKAGSSCVPIPTDGPYGRRRRQLGRTYLADKDLTGSEFLSKLKLIYLFETWPPAQHDEIAHLNDASPADSFKLEITFPNWQLYEYERLENERFTNIFLTIFQRPEPESEELLAVNLYECRDLSDTNNFMLQALSVYAEILSRVNSPGIGELAFNYESGRAVLFRRGSFVAVVRSVGRLSFSVVEIATSLDQFLNQPLASG